MLTQKQVLDEIKAGRGCRTIDGRDYRRLVDFFPVPDWSLFGFVYTGVDPLQRNPKPWTEEAIRTQLKRDVEFGLGKAGSQRGISSSLMVEVVAMWMWVLEDPELAEVPDYYDYGVAYLEEVAAKYGIAGDLEHLETPVMRQLDEVYDRLDRLLARQEARLEVRRELEASVEIPPDRGIDILRQAELDLADEDS